MHPKTLRIALALASVLWLSTAVAQATNFVFDAGQGSDPPPPNNSLWSDPRNWAPDGVPGAGDTVTINIPNTVDLGGVTRSVLRLTLANGSQFGTDLRHGTLNLTGSSASFISTWTSGNIGCNLNIAAGARLNISGDTNRAIVLNAVINNDGTVVWSGLGGIDALSGSVFNNKNLFLAQGGGTFSDEGATFNNLAGATVTKSGAGTTNRFAGIHFNNAGTVNANGGTLDLLGGGTSNGTFNAASGGRVNVSGNLTGTFNPAAGGIIGVQNPDSGVATLLNTGAKFIGAGLCQVIRGGVTVNGTITVGEAGGPGTLQFALAEFSAFTGTAHSNLISAGSGFYDWRSGNVGGAGSVVNIGVGCQFHISGDANRAMLGGTINNFGTVTWTGLGGLQSLNASVFNNKSGGVFNAQGGGTFSGDGGPFNNLAGSTFNKTGAGTTNTFQGVDFNNAGTVNANGGTLDLNGGGTSNGIYNAASGARVNVSGNLTSTFNAAANGVIGVQGVDSGAATLLNTGAKFIGAGKSVVFNRLVSVNGTITTGEAGGPGTLEIAFGDFNFFTGTPTGSLTSAGTGFYDWKVGDIGTASGGVINIAGSGRFHISSNANHPLVGGATINNSGVVTWTDDGDIQSLNGAVFNNKSGSVFNAQGGGTFTGDGGAFNNQAGSTFNKSSVGTTTTFQEVDFNNAGTVSALSGTLDLNGGGTSSGPYNAAAGGRVNVSGNLTSTFNPATGGIVGVQGVDSGAATLLNTGARFIGAGKSVVFNRTVSVNGTITTGQPGGPGTLEIDLGDFNAFTGTAGGSLTSAGTGFYDWKRGVIGTGSGGIINLADNAVFKISGSANHALEGATINNTGLVDWTEGQVSFDFGAAFNNKLGGIFNVPNGANLGGSNGSPSSLINAGTLNVGASPGIFNINGVNFTNASTGIINIELGGLTPGTQFDQIAVVNAAVTLGGTLDVRLINGFVPAGGDAFTVVTYPSHTGIFSFVSSPFAATYNAGDVTLTAPANALFLSVDPTTFAEDDGGAAAKASVVRNGPTTSGLTVNLSSSDPKVTVPGSVGIPAGATSSALFNVGAVDNAVPDGTKFVTLSATAAGLATAKTKVTVLDDDPPALSLAVKAGLSNVVSEGAGANATRLILSRNGDLSAALAVNVTSSDTSAAVVHSATPPPPATVAVTIPAGQASVEVQIDAIDDTLADGFQKATFTATRTGFLSATLAVVVLNNDLTLNITPTSFSEAAGANASQGTVSRGAVPASAPAVIVNLTKTTPSANPEASVPPTVTIAAGQASATFAIAAVNDSQVDGAQIANIKATASGFIAANKAVTVTDNDVKALSLTVSATSFSESGAAVPATITRNADLNSALTVTLTKTTSSTNAEVSVPVTVTLPIGVASVNFNLTPVNDAEIDGSQAVTIKATAAGYVSSSVGLTVTDDDLPASRASE